MIGCAMSESPNHSLYLLYFSFENISLPCKMGERYEETETWTSFVASHLCHSWMGLVYKYCILKVVGNDKMLKRLSWLPLNLTNDLENMGIHFPMREVSFLQWFHVRLCIHFAGESLCRDQDLLWDSLSFWFFVPQFLEGIKKLLCCLLENVFIQKQPPRGVPRKRCSEKMQQIYRRTPMPKCDFNKVALQLRHALQIALRHGCSPVTLLHIFGTPFLNNTSGRLLLIDLTSLPFVKYRRTDFIANNKRMLICHPCSWTD